MAWLNSARAIGLAAAAAMIVGMGRSAQAGPITASYQAAGAQTADFTKACGTSTNCSYGTEAFTGWQGGAFNSTFSSGTSNFTATNYISGAYTARGDPNWQSSPANQYGGAGGTSNYPELFGNSPPGDAYSINLAHSANIPGVNYFGLWITALDPFNDLQFYSNGKLVFSFGASDLQAALGPCTAAGGYCGNPTTKYSGQNSGEQYAFVNFFDTVGYFDQIVLYNTSNSGFESSNHSFAYINQYVQTGTPFTVTDQPPNAAMSAKIVTLIPEPASVVLVFTALVVLLFRHQRRRAAQAAAEPSAPEVKKHRRRRRRSRSRSRPAQTGWPAGTPSRFSS